MHNNAKPKIGRAIIKSVIDTPTMTLFAIGDISANRFFISFISIHPPFKECALIFVIRAKNNRLARDALNGIQTKINPLKRGKYKTLQI